MLEAAARLYQRPILVVIHYEERCLEFQVTPKTILSEEPICLGFVHSDNHYVYLQ